MDAKSSSSFLVSLTLHGFVALMIFLTTMYVSHHEKEPPHIIELVAGPPTNPEAQEAPKLGNTSNPTKLIIPKIDLPAEEEAEPEPPTPVPPAPTPPQPEKAPPVPPKPTPKSPDKPKPVANMAKEMKKSAKISYQDYLKKNPIPKTSPSKPAASKGAKVPRIDTEGIAGGVREGSVKNKKGGGGGKALTREQQSLYDTYFSFLINALKQAHEPPAGVSDRLEAEVTFDITASGSILNPKITKSSGNREFDESVLSAFRRVKSIGPPPDRKPGTFSVTFKMRDE